MRTEADALKAAVPAAVYYPHTLATMPTPKGREWVDGGLCPFHDDKHRGNFRVNLDTGAFHCFACGVSGGDILAFHQQARALSFPDTLTDLSRLFLGVPHA